MIVFINSDGSVSNVSPTTITQGSNNAQSITMVMEAASAFSAVNISFTLPDGSTVAGGILTPESITLDDTLYYGYLYNLKTSVTNFPGTVTVGYDITDSSGDILATYNANFTVTATTQPILPEAPGTDWYDEVTTAYAYITGKIDTDIPALIDANIETHNTDINSHENIQTAISLEIAEDIETHNTDIDAHENIQVAISAEIVENIAT